MKQIQRSTVKALFQRESGEVMVAKSARDEFWELPGGKVEFGEQPQETLRREVEEEFGVKDFEINDLLDMFSFRATDEVGEWSFVVSVFLCKLNSENLTISDEHEKVAWIKPEDVRSYPMREGYYKVIENLKI